MDAYLKFLNNAPDSGCARIVEEVLDDERIYHFGQLLESPRVIKLSESEEYRPLWELLKVFAYGTLSDYKRLQPQLPQINDHQLEKLKHLTLVSFASKEKILPYETIMQELSCDSEQQMEDLVINTIYKGLISAKLDQRRRLIEVDYVIGRDVSREELRSMHSLLTAWSAVCEQALGSLNESIAEANAAATIKKREDVEFTQNLQDVRVKYASSSADGDAGSAHDSQYASSEYQREEQRTSDK
ncbi:hypothetical protein GGI12_005192 [Dipsacomyces acuminosporus]|nr:hypothetical protein GGI12_005192 [Dipsacomyces acuminosporus]